MGWARCALSIFVSPACSCLTDLGGTNAGETKYRDMTRCFARWDWCTHTSACQRGLGDLGNG